MAPIKKSSLNRVSVIAVLLSLHAGYALAADLDAATETLECSNTLSDSELDTTRGAGIPAISNQTLSELSSSVTGNTAIGTVSGANSIDTGALSGINGLTAVIQNSGNNVSIQEATTVSVIFN